jgi:hypothetical protein
MLPCLARTMLSALCLLIAAERAHAQPRVDLQVQAAEARLGARPAPLVQLPTAYTPDLVDPWQAERRARFTIAVGTGLTLASSTFLIGHPAMHRARCTYHHSYGPAVGGIATGLGLALVASGALWLVREHHKQRAFRNNLGAAMLFALGGALVGTVSTLWLESIDSNGCHPRFNAHI